LELLGTWIGSTALPFFTIVKNISSTMRSGRKFPWNCS
jgi:hypothetical protein